MRGRLVMPVLWVTQSLIGCVDYDKYARERSPLDASPEASADAGSIPDSEAGDGSPASPNAKDAGTDGAKGGNRTDGSLDATRDSPSDARTEHTGTPDSASDTGPESSVDGDARVVVQRTLTFDTVSEFREFSFVTPQPSNLVAAWEWIGAGNPRIREVNPVLAGPSTFPSGTFAIHEPHTLGDVEVSVRVWSTDIDSGGILLRYVDETHYYRFIVSEAAWVLARADGTSNHYLGCGGLCPAPFPTTPFQLNHDAPGNVLKFSAIGQTLQCWINGQLVATVTDTTYPSGKVGLYVRGLADANFDDMIIRGTLASASADSG